MITEILVGDITSDTNTSDIIIGMNSDLDDVTGIGLPFVGQVSTVQPIELGSVLSFHFDETRDVHMIICHRLGWGGWEGADKHVRFGMDFLHHTNKGRKFSVVQIGTGRVGKRDGANDALILTAMSTSFLPVTLYVFNPREAIAAHDAKRKPMVPFHAWHPVHGEEEIRVAA